MNAASYLRRTRRQPGKAARHVPPPWNIDEAHFVAEKAAPLDGLAVPVEHIGAIDCAQRPYGKGANGR